MDFITGPVACLLGLPQLLLLPPPLQPRLLSSSLFIGFAAAVGLCHLFELKPEPIQPIWPKKMLWVEVGAHAGRKRPERDG
jgi:hypothetical protein